MQTAFASLVPDARAFLAELRENNDRDWFQAHKATYDDRLRGPATALLDSVAAELETMTGAPCETKLFRPNRDVRFSKDKTPYTTHLHMLWRSRGFWFLGISPDDLTLGAGRMRMEKAQLDAFRRGVDGPGGDTLDREYAALADKGFRMGEPDLKRVPAPYPADHRHAHLLRRKSVTAWTDLETPPDDLHATTLRTFRELLPFQTALSALV